MLLMIQTSLLAQKKYNLYTTGVPNMQLKSSLDVSRDVPEIFVYKPQKDDRQLGVLIIPGGGYAKVAIDHEGHEVARMLAEEGYTAIVLKYRLPDDHMMIDKTRGPIEDVQEAIRWFRIRQDQLGIEVNKVGVLGFSAGGHLAATASTLYKTDFVENIEGVSLRPDFSILLYPVISMDFEHTHRGSRLNLLGDLPGERLLQQFSPQENVTDDTPPTYLMHARDDQAVSVENSLLYKQALEKNSVPCQLFLYERGGHGFGLHNTEEDGEWFDDLLIWLETL